MSAYMIYVRDRITDPAEMKKYEEESAKVSLEGRMPPLAFYGDIETLEGPEVDGATIIPFPDMQAARDAYDDPVYQNAVKHRFKGADYRVFIVDGVD